MIDTHCHLNFKAFNNDLTEVVRRFKEAGGEKVIVVGAKSDSSQKAIDIAGKNAMCFAAVGIHPHHIDDITSMSEAEKTLYQLASNSKVVAIGETGIDYYTYKDNPPVTEKQKKKQKFLFNLHLKIADELRLPVIIHCREAQDDLMMIISDFMKNRCITGVFHCFDGSRDYLEQVLTLGFFVGFDGNITYKDNDHLRNLVKHTPLDRLLVETDSPYLPPVPYRGIRNEPAYLKETIKAISFIKDIDSSKIEQITSGNAKMLFKL